MGGACGAIRRDLSVETVMASKKTPFPPKAPAKGKTPFPPKKGK